MHPKVSVIVPVYNLELYIERCLLSVVRQRFDRPYEVLVVNDGSTDDSQLIIDEVAAAHPGILRCFVKENGGHGAACNYGIERASGDYLIFVDGDDFLGEDTLQEMYDKAVETGADLLIGHLVYHFDTHTEPYRPIPELDSERMLSAGERILLFKNWATPCGRLYHRRLFADRDVRMPEGVIHADVSFAPKTYFAAERIYYTPRDWYHYDLTRPDQSIKATTRRIMDIVPVLTDMLEFFERKGAFERYRYELEYYTLNHVLSWVPKVRRLKDYPVRQGLKDIFGVMNQYFPGWLSHRPVRELARSSFAMELNRAASFGPMVMRRKVKRGFQLLYRASHRAAHGSVNAVEKMRQVLERHFGDINAPF
ncbi:MAG: glycosyltransferase family 2 protein [Myxococcales bacterium]|jgi:glycosyltransferase involved in cell wall biosynthesis